MSDKLIKIGISHGDINGISYELMLKVFEDIRIFESCVPVVYGHAKVLSYYKKVLDLPPVNINTINNAREVGVNRLNIVNCGNEELAVDISRPTPESEAIDKAAFQRAVEDLKSGIIDVLVMAPSNIDETDYLISQIGNKNKALKILVQDGIRVALASNKVPLSEALPVITTEFLTEKIKNLHASLVHDFSLSLPRIAVLSLNPAVGIIEQHFGKEETEIIIPAIKAANDAGAICFGPYSADGFFSSDDFSRFDAVLAMYHDQGVAPFRSITSDEGVQYYSGLQFVVTSPDTGVSYEKAGKNESSESSFRNAIYLAIDIFNVKKMDKEITVNPLKKQYFERGSDNEKLDLTKDE
jgi:4-hydroxythreonine-4-phosphate dehydrogenase